MKTLNLTQQESKTLIKYLRVRRRIFNLVKGYCAPRPAPPEQVRDDAHLNRILEKLEGEGAENEAK